MILNSPPNEEVKKEEVKEEDVVRINEEKWPSVNGVYDAQGEWHDWNDLTYGHGYENSELIILPYTVCIINLYGSSEKTPNEQPASSEQTVRTDA